MSIKTILKNKEELVSGEFYVFGTAKQWFLADASGVLAFDASNIEMGSRVYRPKIGDRIDAGLVIEYEGETPKVFGRVIPVKMPKAPLMSLPYPALPKPELVQELNGYIHSLTYQPIRAFINNLLMQEEIAIGMARAPASRAHHHPEQGGLLRHVVEMAEAALKQDFWLKPTAYERELLLVAVIIHDIGKVDADILSRKKKALSRKHHKEIGKELVKQPLKQLELDNPHVARDLKAVIRDVLGKYRTSETKVGRLLQTLDQDSAYRDGDLLSFKDTPAHVNKAHLNGKPGPGRTYYRVRHLTVIK